MSCQTLGDGSAKGTYTNLVIPDMKRVYAAVIATNAEGLETPAVSSLIGDVTAPLVLGLEVRRTLDGEWDDGSEGLVYHNGTVAIEGRFRLLEPSPANITRVQFGVGTIPGHDDVLAFDDIGYQTQIEAKARTYFEVKASALPLENNRTYYLAISTLNSVGINGVVSSVCGWLLFAAPGAGSHCCASSLPVAGAHPRRFDRPCFHRRVGGVQLGRP